MTPAKPKTPAKATPPDEAPVEAPQPDPLANMPVEERVEQAKEEAKRGKLPIEHFTNRGDWEDPFSRLIVPFDVEVCPESGARRDGDFAVLEG